MSDQSGSRGGRWARPSAEQPEDVVSAESEHDGLAEPRTVVLGGEPAARPRRRRGLVAATGALALALVAAGGVYAYSLLSGGGAQPEKYVPANAIAFVKLDLDPAAGQKVAALRFFRHFPGGSKALRGDDVREIIFNLLQEDNAKLQQLDFDKDIAPWLGNRLAVAVLPGTSPGDEPTSLGVLQVKDPDRARKGLPKLLDGDDPPAMVFTGGYALLADDEAMANAARDAAAKSNLGEDEQFRADLEPLGHNVAAFWVDLTAVGDQLESSRGRGLAGLPPGQAELFQESFRGRIAGAVTFDGNHADLTVRGAGTSGFAVPSADAQPVGSWMSSLPESTVIAVGVSGMDKAVRQLFAAPALDSFGFNRSDGGGLAELERQTRLRLPEDITALLGRRALLTVDSYIFESAVPQGVVLRSETDARAAGGAVKKLNALLRDSGAPFKLSWQRTGSDVLVGLSPDDLSAPPSGPGVRDPAFKEALPNLESAQQAIWVDLDGIAEAILAQSPGSIDPSDQDVLRHIAGIGLTSVSTKEGSTTTLRVVAD